MKDGIDDDGIVRHLVENLEGKTPNERSAKLVHSGRIKLWVSLDGKHARLHTSQEVFAQSRLVAFIPVVGIYNVILRLWRVDDLLNHAATVPAL